MVPYSEGVQRFHRKQHFQLAENFYTRSSGHEANRCHRQGKIRCQLASQVVDARLSFASRTSAPISPRTVAHLISSRSTEVQPFRQHHTTTKNQKGYVKAPVPRRVPQKKREIKSGGLLPGGVNLYAGRHAVYFTLAEPIGQKKPNQKYKRYGHLRHDHDVSGRH